MQSSFVFTPSLTSTFLPWHLSILPVIVQLCEYYYTSNLRGPGPGGWVDDFGKVKIEFSVVTEF